MSDQSSSSNPTRSSTSSTQQEVTFPLKQVDTVSASSGNDGPEESQVPEPPPGGGQQPGEDLDRAQPSTSNS
jgi:hypothetical protein